MKSNKIMCDFFWVKDGSRNLKFDHVAMTFFCGNAFRLTLLEFMMIKVLISIRGRDAGSQYLEI